MPPIHDIDVLFLLATSIAAKRRPAEPAEIVAAIDLIQASIPTDDKLAEVFARLGSHGLLRQVEGAIALTEAALKVIEILPRKGDYGQRQIELKGLLGAAQTVPGEPLVVTAEQWQAAIQAHRATVAGRAKNLLIPKPKPEAAKARPGQRQRKPLPKQKKR